MSYIDAIICFVTCVKLTGFAEYCIWPSMAKNEHVDTCWFDFWVLACRPLNCVVADTTSTPHTLCVIASAESYDEAILHLFLWLWAFGCVCVCAESDSMCVQTSSALHIRNTRVRQLV